ncbi:MAG: short chain dehydrogenase [Nitrospirales bacterium]|nr:MAG: short chain dehydrogenase [Nitrospirales bacterium]
MAGLRVLETHKAHMSIFSEKVIIITGASEGIGRALALALAPQQPKLVLAARNAQRLLALAAECEQIGAASCVVPTDVSDEQACQRLVQQTIETFGTLDVLVNNAGISMRAKLEEVSDLSVFEHIMKVNYLSSVYCTKYALPYLKQSKGRVVAVASVAGVTGVPTRTGYCASKHAMVGFFESLRMELEDAGISVTIIAPDFVVSKIHERSFDAHGQRVGESPANQHTYLTAESCAAMIIKAMATRQRLLLTSWRGYWGRSVRIVLPYLIDGIAKKAVKEEIG